MAVKFKSKYTGPEIEALLDSIGSTISGAIIPVDELPAAAEANTASFYRFDKKIYFSTGKEWIEVGVDDGEGGATADPAEGIINSTEVMQSGKINFADFIQYDDLYHTLSSDSETAQYFSALRSAMAEQGKTYYVLTEAAAYGFIDNFENNNLLSATIADNHGFFLVKMDLVDGTEVDITLKTIDDQELYLIEYVGYAL
jgi:hypothetical protein